MVFSSLIFILVFLTFNLLCYFFVDSIKVKNIVLLLFSLVFYAWGEPVYVFILIVMSWFCWVFSRLIDKTQKNGVRRFVLLCAVLVCIASIGYFKYAGFIVENINALVGSELFAVPEVSLPIGISFYTFQLLTYVVDVYRKEVPAQKKYWCVLLYAGLFHQCVAGPIVRYGDIEEQIMHRKEDIESVSRGITRFTFGLAKKSVLANSCAAVADTLLLSDAAIANKDMLIENILSVQSSSALTLWVGMAFYMLQIYLDFSAYSDMAIGLGLICGFRYKENFDYPYCSGSVTEFWRRWHISLGTFFRDYVYIPLGGNRKGKSRTYINLFIVWALTGLWHGASWNFVLWGLYFFVFLVIEKAFLGKILKRGIFSRIYLLAVVFFGWIFFKFTDMTLLISVFRGMFALNSNEWYTYESLSFAKDYIFFFLICVLACTPVYRKLGERVKVKAQSNKLFSVFYNMSNVLIPAVLLVVSCLALVGDSYNPFIYFQF